MSVLAKEVERLGGRVVEQFVQRRGVSGNKKGRAPGGKANMDRPYSSRTLMSTGKVDEIAAVRVETDAKAVVFANELTTRQRAVLAELLGCPVFSHGDLCTPKTTDLPNGAGTHESSV
ncbi:HflX-like GTP-binding protein [Actinomadura napierensis]|uniref:GTPase HflX N-terminal domain-containing protein n=1 Tax=Actinomadura napierensis TaxID=267854 RepID=A0ABN2ZPG0_9ACTN